MQLSHSHHFIFIHIFKTAGTSMRAVFDPFTRSAILRLWHRFRSRLGSPPPPQFPQLSDHARAAEIRDVLPGELYDRYFKFAFVRNPWDWQVSWYHYVLQNLDHHEHAAVSRLTGFEDYLRWRIDHPVWNQKAFVTDENGRTIVDFIGRFENLRTDFARICALTGVRARLPHLNRSRHADFRSYYTDRACDLLLEYCREDIEYFGYPLEPAHEAAASCPAPVVSSPIYQNRAA